MTSQSPLKSRFASFCRELLRDAAKTSYTLFKITVPIIILMRLLQQAGAIGYLGALLGPVMRLVGLPGESGLVWATAMATNLYGALAAFAAVGPGLSLSVGQITVLTTMMLVAHALPVELRIAQKAGPRFRMMALLRVGGALLLGAALHHIFALGHWLGQPNQALWRPAPPEPAWSAWAIDQGRNLAMIFLVILTLLLIMRILAKLGLMDLLMRLLEPVLRLLGMSRAAAPLTIIGMTMGISYGGGLIIQEARSGRLSPRDVFFSLSLLSLAHSLVEDTMLMVALGASLWGVLVGRVIFALAAIFLLVRLVGRISDKTFNRLFYRPRPTAAAP